MILLIKGVAILTPLFLFFWWLIRNANKTAKERGFDQKYRKWK